MGQEEAVGLEWSQVNMQRREITLYRTRTNRPRVVSLSEEAAGTPRHIYRPYVFWHEPGERHHNFAARFATLVEGARKEATEAKRPVPAKFRCRDLRYCRVRREKSVAISFYDLSVPTFLQTVGAVGGFLDRAVTHCAETDSDPDDIVQVRLFPDMAPFHFQIEALVHHAVSGVEAVKTGVFAPPPLVGAMPFSDLRAMVAQAVTALETFTPDEVNSWSDKELNIELHRPLDEDDAWTPWDPRTLAFTPETFLLSFSMPNVHFHAVTAYNILRTRGVPLGKRDYEGRLRTQTA